MHRLNNQLNPTENTSQKRNRTQNTTKKAAPKQPPTPTQKTKKQQILQNNTENPQFAFPIG
jgi:hypothetical protein